MALLLAGSCLAVLGAVLIAPVLPKMEDHFAGVAGADVLVPIVLTVPALIIGLTAPFAGIVIDAVDRKRLLIVALVVYAIAGTAPLYLSSLGQIIASRAVVGLCEAAIMTCCTTLIADYWSGPKRSRYLGLQTLAATLAATVFLALGGALGAAGWRTPFWVYAVALLLVVPMTKLLWQPATGPRPAKLPPLPWRGLLVPCLITLVGGVVFYALIVQLSFVLDDLGVTSSAAIGGVSAAMSLATAAGSASFARLSRQRPRTLLPIAFGLAATGLAVVFAAPNVPLVTLGAMITGAGTGLLLPVLLTWATNRLRFDQRGRGTGLWTGFLFVGEFASPLLVAGFGAAAGGLQPALGVLAAVAAVLAIVTLLVVPQTAPPLNVTT
ncbi:MFS family permease [Actinoplanes tereljensis]|uniref:MFS transporter n=1 Tax=Paractinoplanes tereljensis TaxID=571912 RepID=A0A919NXC6_9ACTN|nr:MFS transporter [Actinoplanes tereljensis]GIF26980.1 MFS transporter [Actinoplanes tereljensis]